MDTLSEKELERLRKLEQLRRLLQMILGSHIRLLIATFVAILAAILLAVYLRAVYSPERFEARTVLYYHPKQTGNVGSYNSKFVLQLLTRNAMRHQFMLENMTPGDRKKAPKIVVSPIERNRIVDGFDIRVSYGNKKKAISLANAFAEHCIRVYTEERTADLQEMKDSLLRKKEDIFRDVQKLDREKNSLDAPMNNLAMEREYDQLRQKLSEHRTARTKLALSLGSLEKRFSALKTRESQLNPALLANEKQLREQTAALKRMDEEIMQAENVYTEYNPKLLAMTARRQTMAERMHKFMAEKNISASDLESLEEAIELSEALRTAESELTVRRDELRILDREIGDTEKAFDRLCDIMPRIQVLNQKYANLTDSLHKLDAQISDINSLMPLIKEDLRCGELAKSAYGMVPFSKKNIVICIFAATSLTLLLASLTVLAEFWLGKVSNAKELSLIPELNFLGQLPTSEAMFSSKPGEQLAFSAICHDFLAMEPKHHVVLIGAMTGGRLLQALFDAFEWNYAMTGKRTLTIEMVPADGFDYDAMPPSDTGIVVYSGGKGFLPVTNRHYLSPSELMLLKQDLVILRKSYDLIFIKHAVSLRHDRLFVEQMVGICDGALIAVGAKKTPRQHLRRLIAFHQKSSLPIMTILSDSTPERAMQNVNLEVGK